MQTLVLGSVLFAPLCWGAVQDTLLFQARVPVSESRWLSDARQLPAPWSAGLSAAQSGAVMRALEDTTDAGDSPIMDTSMRLGPGYKDWPGLRHDMYYYLGVQFAVIGTLYVLPESVSAWSQEQKDAYSLDKWRSNVQNPVWDQDQAYINYVLHPYWGSSYYTRARERGFDRLDSFWYASFLSFLYEFGAEALFERPSIQDLIVTPTGGVLLGMYFEDVRARIKQKGRDKSFLDKTTLVLTDPLGAVADSIDGLFGVDASVQLMAFSSQGTAAGFGAYPALGGNGAGQNYADMHLGLQLQIPW